MVSLTLIDPRQTVVLESGYGLDRIGAMRGIDLPRASAETDLDYRARLMARLWEPLIDSIAPAVATGIYLDQWLIGHTHGALTSGETTAPPDDTKPRENHVRDAVRANL